MADSTVKMNDFPRQWAATGGLVHEALERVGQSGWWILGKEVEAFERELSAAWGLPHTVGVANGLDAIEIALRAAELPPGSKVLTTPLSAFATALAILRAGHTPVFSDVDSAGLLDLDRAAQVLAADSSIRAMVPVHLFGHALNLETLATFASRFGVVVIEDAAQAIGAQSSGRPVGSVGLAAATSFYPTKNLGAMGDGGALLTTNPAIAARARVLRDYGQSKKYVHDVLGSNSRLDELHAAILRDAFLPQLEAGTARRRAIGQRYLENIEHPDLELVPPPAGSESVFHLFPVLVRSAATRPSLMAHLTASGIQSGIHYPLLLSAQAAISNADVRGTLERAERFASSEVSLPIHPFLTDLEVDRVIDAVRSWRPV